MATLNPNLGVIFHWGVYSVPAYDANWTRRRTVNGSEWYLGRLLEKSTFRPVSGYQETQAYHTKTYGSKTYYDLASEFTAESWNPDAWMALCKQAYASYVILTVRHHDGFCLWPSSLLLSSSSNGESKKQWSVKDYGPKTDILARFKESAQKHGLKWGVYYSWSEFGKSCTKKYMDTVVVPQVRELQKYNPDIWWFDGDWECTSQYSNTVIATLCDEIKRLHPHCEINDRLGAGKSLKSEKSNLNMLIGKSTYRVYADRYLPSEIPKVPWEHVNTISNSWGRNKMQAAPDYKSGIHLFNLYTSVRAKGGKLLLNFGPNPDGTLDPKEVESFTAFGKLHFRP